MIEEVSDQIIDLLDCDQSEILRKCKRWYRY